MDDVRYVGTGHYGSLGLHEEDMNFVFVWACIWANGMKSQKRVGDLMENAEVVLPFEVEFHKSKESRLETSAGGWKVQDLTKGVVVRTDCAVNVF